MPTIFQSDYGFRVDSKLEASDGLYIAMRINAFAFDQVNKTKKFQVKKCKDFFHCSDAEFLKIKKAVFDYQCLMENPTIYSQF